MGAVERALAELLDVLVERATLPRDAVLAHALDAAEAALWREETDPFNYELLEIVEAENRGDLPRPVSWPSGLRSRRPSAPASSRSLSASSRTGSAGPRSRRGPRRRPLLTPRASSPTHSVVLALL